MARKRPIEILRATKDTQFPADTLFAIAEKESSFDINNRPPKGSALGLMQFLDQTWPEAVKKYGGEFGLATFGTMDDAIVIEGHFFVAEDDCGTILGSGGWSRSRPGYQSSLGAAGLAAPAPYAPTVRSVFVDPAAARCGVGSAIMLRGETDALQHGIPLLRLTATLSGVPLYKKLGYRVEEATEIRFPDQTGFGCVKMEKSLARAAGNYAHAG